MDRRLYASLSAAAALHAALLVGVALSGTVSETSPTRAPLLSVDLITLRDEPPPPPEPQPQREPPREPEPASAVTTSRPLPAARARRTAAAVLAAKGASEAAIVPEGSDATGDDGASDPGSAAAPGEGERRAPIDLGLSGSIGRWALQAEQDKQRSAPKDVGGLQSGLMQDDTANGRGPGFEIATRLLERGRDLAPVGATATAQFVVELDGRISSAVLLESSAGSRQWHRVLRDLLESLPRVRRPPSRRMRAHLSLVSRASAPSGKASSGSGISFDVSNIGAAQQHWFHVRVLAQVPE